MSVYELMQQEMRDHVEVTAASAAIIGAAAGAAAMRFVSRTLHTEGSVAFTYPEAEHYEAITASLEAVGTRPRVAIDDEDTLRAVFPGSVILNRTRLEVWEEMGKPLGGPIWQSRRPERDAGRLAERLREDHGYDVTTMPYPSTGDKMWFVINNPAEKPDGSEPRHLPGVVFGYRRAFPLMPGRPRFFPGVLRTRFDHEQPADGQ